MIGRGGRFVAAAGLVGVAFALYWLGRDRSPRRLPNLILISIDTLRADHLSSYGYSRETTPNLDRLAREGARFRRVIADSSWTLPTHATLFTGLGEMAHEVGYGKNRLADEQTTIAERVKEAGYRTAGFWSGPFLHPFFGFGQGFDRYEGVLGSLYLDDAERVENKQSHQMNLASHEAITSPAVIGKGIEFLTVPSDQPFFLFLHLFDPHYDFLPPEDLWRRFDPDYRGNVTSHRFAFSPLIRPDMPQRDLDHIVALYDAEILFTDQYIGLLLDTLDDLGLADETVIAITSDHGEEFFEHGEKGHRNHLHDEVVQVPWIVWHPAQIEAGTEIDAQARHIDVMPTLLGLLGIQPNEPFMGEDLSPVLRGEATARDLPAISRLLREGNEVHTSIRTKAWKWMRVEKPGVETTETWFDLTATSPLGVDARGDSREGELARRRLAVLDQFELALRAAISAGTEGDRSVIPAAIEAELREMGYIR